MTKSLRILMSLIAPALLAGCGDLNSPLLTNHNAKDRRGQAHERWDNVRGEVKLRLAKQHLDAGRLEDAEKVLDQAAGVTPKDPQVFVLLARLRLEQGRLAEARQAIVSARALNADDAEIHYLAGMIAQRYGEVELAVDAYQSALQRMPNNANYLLAVGESLVAVGRDIDALELIEGRAADFDSNAPVQMLAARICRLVGLRNTAVEHAREALRITPDDPFVIADVAELMLWAGRYQEVIATLQPVTDRAGNKQTQAAASPQYSVTSGIRRCMASAYLALSRPADAMRALDPVMSGAELDDATRILFARAALDAGDFTLADRTLQPLRAAGQPALEVLLLSAAISFESGDRATARSYAARALIQDAKSLEARRLLDVCDGVARRPSDDSDSKPVFDPVSCQNTDGVIPIYRASDQEKDARWRP
ncbi:MAG: tetratricopeptide repeat protein [Planctomycetes bacterium]|nr:tetratricopeptide repeat protein [Planctomycetota bacterium]